MTTSLTSGLASRLTWIHAPFELEPLVVRVVLPAEQASRDHGHVVVGRERLAELREQVRGRLDPRPVVLIEDEQARTAATRHGG